ncbi:MAG TPA: SCO family protein [Sphingobacteriaceae bacterium]|nr:SCO family protein [Sphingobacteriaceae bacterium]
MNRPAETAGKRKSKLIPFLIGTLVVVTAGVIAFAVFRPLQVLPRIRPLPPWVLTDHTGQSYSSADVRDKTLLVGFLATRDPQVSQRLSQLKEFWAEAKARQEQWAAGSRDGAGAPDLQVALITVDPEHDDPPTLAAFAADHGLDREGWRLLTGSPLSVKLVVGGGLEVFYGPVQNGAGPDAPPVYEPVLVLLDGTGMIRGRYMGDPLATDLLLRDLELLQREMVSTGAQRLGYEAAHLFLCYPR